MGPLKKLVYLCYFESIEIKEVHSDHVNDFTTGSKLSNYTKGLNLIEKFKGMNLE